MRAGVAFELAERFEARYQIVADTPEAAELIVVAVVVAGRGAVSELRIRVDGAIDGAEACVAAGLEGIVLKRLDSRYEPGKRSRHWVRAKTSGWKADHAPSRHER